VALAVIVFCKCCPHKVPLQCAACLPATYVGSYERLLSQSPTHLNLLRTLSDQYLRRSHPASAPSRAAGARPAHRTVVARDR
jgi:hypothetical protein